jgi:hypothetical protein
MPIELNHAGGGVAAYLLSLNTLLVLGKNGTLAHNEVAEVVDRSLMQLETVDQEPSLQSEEAARLARALLEQARARSVAIRRASKDSKADTLMELDPVLLSRLHTSRYGRRHRPTAPRPSCWSARSRCCP